MAAHASISTAAGPYEDESAVVRFDEPTVHHEAGHISTVVDNAAAEASQSKGEASVNFTLPSPVRHRVKAAAISTRRSDLSGRDSSLMQRNHPAACWTLNWNAAACAVSGTRRVAALCSDGAISRNN